MKLKTGWPRLWLLAAVAGLAGCGGAPVQLPDTAPFSGKVMLDGAPLSGASVMFTPDRTTKSAHPAMGQTNTEGEYELSTTVGSKVMSGAVPGDYRVLISLWKTEDGEPVDQLSEIPQPGKESLKPEYSDPEKSGLVATVPNEGGTKDFDLRSK